MLSREEKKRILRSKADKAMNETNEELSEDLESLLFATTPDLEELKPIITDGNKYNRLIAAVEESTRRNENAAQLKDRLIKIGLTAIEIGKVIGKLKGF